MQLPLITDSTKQNVLIGETAVPIVASCDVLVAGGGSAGVAAAVSAARHGAKTLLIERNAFFGGVSTATMMALAWAPFDSMTGLNKEIFSTLISRGQAAVGPGVPFDHEGMKELYFQMIRDAGVRALVYSWVTDVIMDGDRVSGCVVQNKSGRQAILADVIIDATGDGDVSAWAGAEFVKGREEDGKMRPVTLLFRLGNVDVKRVADWAQDHPDEFLADKNINYIRRPDKLRPNAIEPDLGFVRLHGFFGLVEKGRQDGVLPEEVHYLRFEYVNFQHNTVLINTVRVYDIDGTDAWQVSSGEAKAREQVRQIEKFCREYVPGCESAFLVDTSTMLGVRETRHVVGDYVMRDFDVYDDSPFLDAIYRNATYMPRYTEVHTPDGREGALDDLGNRTGAEYNRIENSVPFSALLVKGREGLLIAGRPISADHKADMVTRNIPVCIGMGQAAGTAAALSVAQGCSPRKLDISVLQDTLVQDGVDIGLPSGG